jgi:hypothetical protein
MNKTSIFIVEDELLIAEELGDNLKIQGYNIWELVVM